MAFDGITTAALTAELSHKLTGGSISRIIQPEKDELYLTIKNQKETYLLYMSANASLPLIYLTDKKVTAPLQAPNFCMLLRKHLQGGRIRNISRPVIGEDGTTILPPLSDTDGRTPSLERVIILQVDHRDEMGDPCVRQLVIEIMGKHSNIILVNEAGTIMDSIKRVPSSMSSVREVLPMRPYFIPQTQDKKNPLTLNSEELTRILDKPMKTAEAFYRNLTGLSPLAAEEICFEAGIDGGKVTAALSDEERHSLAAAFETRMAEVRDGCFMPQIASINGQAKDFACFLLTLYDDAVCEPFESVSDMLAAFYSRKNKETRMREKSAVLRHQVTTALERVGKKAQIQEKQLKDAEKKDKYRLYGELLNTYGYSAGEGAKSLDVINYYTNEPMTIPLDPTLSAQANSQKYFERYNKLKRTEVSVTEQLKQTCEDREQLESILTAIDLAENDADLSAIRRELMADGWIRFKADEGGKGAGRKGDTKRSGGKAGKGNKGKVREEKSRPMLFRSSDGFLIAVGKNNEQNDELTFRFAAGNDWWFHAKGQPGSHVILHTEGKDVPDRAFEEAGSLAAYYCKGRTAPKVEIDYTQKKNVRKTPGAKAGFVIYYTNYSMMAVPDISHLERLE